MLYTQAIIVTILSALFLFMPSVNGSYWLLTALAAQLYMLMYFIMFIAAIKLRLSEPDHPRPFKIPGGLFGMLFVAGVGIIGVITTFAVSFMPPEDINVGSLFHYELTLIIGLIVMCAPPFITTWIQSKKIDLEPVI
jgi:amino acid transporter